MTTPDFEHEGTSATQRASLVAARGFLLLTVIGLIGGAVFSGLAMSSVGDESGLRILTVVSASLALFFYFLAWLVFLREQYGARSLFIIPALVFCAWLATAGRVHMPVASIVMTLACLGLALGAAILLLTLRVVLHRELKLGANI
jgi:hypothetical protein